MKVSVSAPLQLLFGATAICSLIVLLRPEPVNLPVAVHQTPAMTAERAHASSKDRPQRPWIRRALPEVEVSAAAIQQVAQTPPLPPPGTHFDANPTPPLPPLPTPSTQQDVVYLGRMIKDNKVQVFFASDGNPVVLGTGGVLNGNWRVEAISAADVTLRNLQTGDTRLVAMGGSANGSASGIVPVQVGQRFLAAQSGETARYVEQQQTQ